MTIVATRIKCYSHTRVCTQLHTCTHTHTGSIVLWLRAWRTARPFLLCNCYFLNLCYSIYTAPQVFHAMQLLHLISAVHIKSLSLSFLCLAAWALHLISAVHRKALAAMQSLLFLFWPSNQTSLSALHRDALAAVQPLKRTPSAGLDTRCPWWCKANCSACATILCKCEFSAD